MTTNGKKITIQDFIKKTLGKKWCVNHNHIWLIGKNKCDVGYARHEHCKEFKKEDYEYEA